MSSRNPIKKYILYRLILGRFCCVLLMGARNGKISSNGLIGSLEVNYIMHFKKHTDEISICFNQN
jgi:hypothetical protein